MTRLQKAQAALAARKAENAHQCEWHSTRLCPNEAHKLVEVGASYNNRTKRSARWLCEAHLQRMPYARLVKVAD